MTEPSRISHPTLPTIFADDHRGTIFLHPQLQFHDLMHPDRTHFQQPSLIRNGWSKYIFLQTTP